MKKILTLLIAVGVFAVANAQYQREDSRRTVLGDRGYYNAYSNNTREYEINRINNQYDASIRQIWYDSYLSRGEKERRVHRLEREREKRIRQIEKEYRHDNGKHLGWDKGVGNPHRNW